MSNLNEEKVLAYLNLDKNEKINKDLMKFSLGSNICVVCFLLVFGLLLGVFNFSGFNIIFIFISVILGFAFLLWYKKLCNPGKQFFYLLIVFLATTFQLFYGYLAFSKFDFIENGSAMFTWLHLLIFCIILSMAIHMLIRFHEVFQDLKLTTIEQTRENIHKKNQKKYFLLILRFFPSVGFSTFFAIQITKGFLLKMQISVSGFALWILMCVGMYCFFLTVPKYVVAKKFNVALLFE